MSIYIRYPVAGSAGGSSGSQTGVPYLIGAFNSLSANANGATIGSFSIYFQAFTATMPGMVSSAAQTFGGVKTFASAPIISTLSPSAPVLTNGSSALVSGSISLTTQVTGAGTTTESASSVLTLTGWTNATIGSPTIQVTQATGSVSGFITSSAWSSFDRRVVSSGTLNFNKFALWDDVEGKIIKTTTSNVTMNQTGAISGVLSLNTSNLTIGSLAGPLRAAGGTVSVGSVSLTNQVVGILSSDNLPPLSSITGSVSLTSQVSGALPLSQTTGSISLINQVSGYFPLVTIGSITHSQVSGGNTYSLNWPSAQGGASTVPQNNGSGVLTWASVLTNPMTTSGDIIVGSGSGTVSRKAIGADGTYLKANSLSPQGLAYEYPSGPVGLKTANYSILATDGTITCASSSFTLTLPLPSALVGQNFSIYKVDENTSGPTVIATTSSQSLSIGSGGAIITSIQLNGPCDYAIIRAINSASFAIVGSKLTAVAHFNTTGGYGATNTKIRNYALTLSNTGNCFTAVSGTTTANGCSVTINLPGFYSFSYTEVFGAAGGEIFGLSINSNQLTTDVTGITTDTILSMQNTGVLDQPANCFWSGTLKAGDVVRPHTRAAADSSVPGRGHFYVTRLN